MAVSTFQYLVDDTILFVSIGMVQANGAVLNSARSGNKIETNL